MRTRRYLGHVPPRGALRAPPTLISTNPCNEGGCPIIEYPLLILHGYGVRTSLISRRIVVIVLL